MKQVHATTDQGLKYARYNTVSRRVDAIEHPMVAVAAQNNDNGIRPIRRNLLQLLINDMHVPQASTFRYESDPRNKRFLIVF